MPIDVADLKIDFENSGFKCHRSLMKKVKKVRRDA